MHLRFWIWHRKDRPLAGIRLNGGDKFLGGEAKEGGVAGWGVSTGEVARTRVLDSKHVHRVGSARHA
jgi:hypothetical protein